MASGKNSGVQRIPGGCHTEDAYLISSFQGIHLACVDIRTFKLCLRIFLSVIVSYFGSFNFQQAAVIETMFG